MKNGIFLPKKLRIGYQERRGTYTGKLAYVTCIDEKGVHRKQKSWESWRHKKIDPTDHDNEPTEGFVLNKKAGGYRSHWNTRQTYARVYDPRGFEFEITIENLLYILENTSAIKGKGLEGEFVYGWSGKDLVLVPVGAADYKEIQEHNDIIHNKTHIKPSELILGATYKTRKSEDWIYMGKFDRYTYSGNKSGKYFFFACDESFYSRKTLGNHLIACISEEPVHNYAELMEKLEGRTDYSPIDPSKDEYVPYTLDELDTAIDQYSYYSQIYARIEGCMAPVSIWKDGNKFITRNEYDRRDYWNDRRFGITYETLEHLHDELQPHYKNTYLKNGRLHRSGKRT